MVTVRFNYRFGGYGRGRKILIASSAQTKAPARRGFFCGL